jgi:muconolactone delta-isomerase
MEYLVTMTTHVPDGTSSKAVDDVRAREAAHTRELAAQGHVLRLWRPPLAPGEWRTIGLFAAASADELEQVLASMPLRVWRSDEVRELVAHSNDPARAATSAVPPASGGMATDFFVTFTPAIPDGTPEQDIKEATAGEAVRTRELAKQGRMIRLWILPAEDGVTPNLGLFRAGNEAEMRAILGSLPLYPYLKTQITRLTPHPSDPAAPGSRSSMAPQAQIDADHG